MLASDSTQPNRSRSRFRVLEFYMHSAPGTVTKVITVTPTTLVTYTSSVSTSTLRVGTVCSTTVTSIAAPNSLSTSIAYVTESHTPAAVNRDVVIAVPLMPSWFTAGCGGTPLPARISGACSCYLTPATIVSTVHSVSNTCFTSTKDPD
jgi:hypothetical protein